MKRKVINEDGLSYEYYNEPDYSKWIAYTVIGLGAIGLLLTILFR